jgi:hypothetical protein
MPKTIPQNGQTNWGTALNDHIGQLMDPNYGGFRIVQTTAQRDADFPLANLTANDEGLTIYNREIGKFQILNITSTDGKYWSNLGTVMSTGAGIAGQGQIVQDNEGWLSLTGTDQTFADLGIEVGCTIFANEKSAYVIQKNNNGSKIKLNEFLGDVIEYNQTLTYTQSSNTLTGTDFTSLNIEIGDHFSFLSYFALAGYIIGVSNTELTVENEWGARITGAGSSWEISKKLPPSNYTYTPAVQTIINSNKENIMYLTDYDGGSTFEKQLNVDRLHAGIDPATISKLTYLPSNKITRGEYGSIMFGGNEWIMDDNFVAKNNTQSGIVSWANISGNGNLPAQRAFRSISGIRGGGDKTKDTVVSFMANTDCWNYMEGGRVESYFGFRIIDSDVPLEERTTFVRRWAFYESLVEDKDANGNPKNNHIGNYFQNKVGLNIGSSEPTDILERLHVNGGNIRVSRTNWPEQYLNIENNGGAGPVLRSRSRIDNAKPLTIDISTDINNTVPTGGTCNFVINSLGQKVFEVSSTGSATLTGTLTQNSDITLKKNVTTLNSSLNVVSQLRGVNFEWKDESREEGKQVGFIAQEVEKVIPEVVKTDENGIKSVGYANIVPVLVEAIKELKAEIEELKKRVA